MSTHDWQDLDKQLLCQDLAKLVQSWDYSENIECLSYEKTGRIAVYNMAADGIPFSFRKVGDKYSIIFNGDSEFIQKETFDLFEGICRTFIKMVRGVV